MSVRLGATVLLCLPLGLAQAAADPTGYTCNFAEGTAHAYDKGQFVAEKPAPVNATHFLEVVTEGYLNITTVYDRDEATGKYPAVHSRHLGILGQPVIAQYQGFCEAKD
jgi:hypothetical protein